MTNNRLKEALTLATLAFASASVPLLHANSKTSTRIAIRMSQDQTLGIRAKKAKIHTNKGRAGKNQTKENRHLGSEKRGKKRHK